MRKSGLFALVAAGLLVVESADAHKFGPGYWGTGGYVNFCLHSDGTVTIPVVGWRGVWSAESYSDESGVVVGGNQSFNDSLSIKGKTFTWNEWAVNLNPIYFGGDLQWTWLGHHCQHEPAAAH